MEKVLSAGVTAPGAINTQPWNFTAVTDIETNEKLSNAMGSMMPPSMPEGTEGQEGSERNDFNEAVTIIKQ